MRLRFVRCVVEKEGTIYRKQSSRARDRNCWQIRGRKWRWRSAPPGESKNPESALLRDLFRNILIECFLSRGEPEERKQIKYKRSTEWTEQGVNSCMPLGPIRCPVRVYWQYFLWTWSITASFIVFLDTLFILPCFMIFFPLWCCHN